MDELSPFVNNSFHSFQNIPTYIKNAIKQTEQEEEWTDIINNYRNR